MPRGQSAAATPSSNWLQLQKKLGKLPQRSQATEITTVRYKKRKLSHPSPSPGPDTVQEEVEISHASTSKVTLSTYAGPESRNGESVSALRKMIAGELELSPKREQPGTYLSMDCEMVGVGLEGKESSLARVSIVNYYGVVMLDEFVRQRERVVDYRTQWSGVRERDLINAKTFVEVQQLVADLIKERVLVGHAVYNDLKALLLSHPRPMTRDTQVLSSKHKVMKGSRPALRNLVHQELGVSIQSGEHSSVIDARATMAVFRLHRKTWEKTFIHMASAKLSITASKKRKLDDTDDASETGDTAQEKQEFPGGGRKGVSSGLSVVVKRQRTESSKGSRAEAPPSKGSRTKGASSKSSQTKGAPSKSSRAKGDRSKGSQTKQATKDQWWTKLA
ncbi:hypothetical protein CERSUDRAFT_87427 [Gelatoporia subvermispora B]|uniref:RNA exonuclease 4 n=1 Tax=Ceriporiopsis subvermispora (strain B) TaxID=914234 RepID=M2Q8C8_CERS8|nr:hypothetical protein CERSUDRAFT_87427 [Gelatoporia subvermispora B]